MARPVRRSAARHPRVTGAWRIALVACALAAGLPVRATAQDMPVPMEVQVSILARVWAFDRAQPARADDELVVGVVYQGRYRASALARTAFERTLSAVLTAQGGPAPHFVAIEAVHTDSLLAHLTEGHVDILYVTPLRALDVREVVRITREAHILSCSGVPDYVEAGVALGVREGGGRPEILINLAGARAEGARFSSEVLRLARLVGGP